MARNSSLKNGLAEVDSVFLLSSTRTRPRAPTEDTRKTMGAGCTRCKLVTSPKVSPEAEQRYTDDLEKVVARRREQMALDEIRQHNRRARSRSGLGHAPRQDTMLDSAACPLSLGTASDMPFASIPSSHHARDVDSRTSSLSRNSTPPRCHNRTECERKPAPDDQDLQRAALPLREQPRPPPYHVTYKSKPVMKAQADPRASGSEDTRGVRAGDESCGRTNSQGSLKQLKPLPSKHDDPTPSPSTVSPSSPQRASTLWSRRYCGHRNQGRPAPPPPPNLKVPGLPKSAESKTAALSGQSST